MTLNYIIYEIKIISLFLAVNRHHILCLKIEKVRQFSVVVTFNKSKITSSIYAEIFFSLSVLLKSNSSEMNQISEETDFVYLTIF